MTFNEKDLTTAGTRKGPSPPPRVENGGPEPMKDPFQDIEEIYPTPCSALCPGRGARHPGAPARPGFRFFDSEESENMVPRPVRSPGPLTRLFLFALILAAAALGGGNAYAQDTHSISISPVTQVVTEGGTLKFTLTSDQTPTATAIYTVTLEVKETGDMVDGIGPTAESRRFKFRLKGSTYSTPAAELTGTDVLSGTANVISISTAADETDEDNSMVTLKITGVTGEEVRSPDNQSISVRVGTSSEATQTVLDDDEPVLPALVFDPQSVRVAEGETAEYTVKLASQPSADVTVTVSGFTNTDASVSSQTLTFTADNWNTERTVTVTAAEDNDATDDLVTLSHSAAGGGYNSITGDVGVTITDNDMAGVAVDPTSLTIDEGSSRDYTVVLESQPSANVTISVGGASGDVSVSHPSLVFSPTDWDTEQTVTVTAAEDPDAIADGVVTLTHSVSGYGSVTAADSVTVNITENDMRGVTVDPTSLTIEEGSSRNYTVVLESQPSVNVTVAVIGASGDVSVSHPSLVFTRDNWNTEQTVTVTAAEDPDAIADGVVTLTHSVSGYGSVTAADSVTVNITENDMRGVTVDPTSLTIEEGSSRNYTVVLESQPSANVTISVGGASGDVSVSHPSLVFSPTDWDTEQTVTVTAAEDPDAIADGVVTLTHSVSGYGSVTAADSVTVNITENDMAGVTVDPTSLTIEEGSSRNYTVVLESQPSANVTISVGGASGDVSVSHPSLVFTRDNWNTEQTVTVTAAEDPDAIADGVVNLTHSVSGGDYGMETASGVSVTITENDMRGVTVDPTSLTIEEGSSRNYTVVLESQPSVNVTVAVIGASGDVSVSHPSLVFTRDNWNTEQTVTVTAAEDPDAIADGVVNLTHSVSGGDYGMETASGVSVTITENDMAGVTVDPTSLTIEEGSSRNYTVVLESQPSANVTISVGGASGDVSVSHPSLVFTRDNWNTEQTVTVTAAEDPDAIADGVVNLTHSVSGGDYGMETASGVSVTITENDMRGVAVDPTSLTIDEGSSRDYTVVLESQPSANVTISVGGASGDVSVSHPSLVFTRDNWNTEQTVTVTAAEDPDAIADGVVNLTHSVSGGDYGMETASGVSVTITENDMRGVAVDPTSLTIDEGSSRDYTVVLESQPSANVTISVGGASGDVSVSHPSLVFSPTDWDTEQTVTVTAAEDPDAIADGVVNLTHSVSGGDYGMETASGVSVTITENDMRGVTVDPTSLTIDEGSSRDYTVVLESQPSANVTISVGGASGDVSVSHASLVFSPTDWDTEQTVTVTAAEDPDAIADGVVNLTHSVSGGDYGMETASGVSVTITENDMRGVTVDPTSLTIDEGSSRDYTVVLESQPSANVTISVGGASGDVSVSHASLVFSPTDWDTEQTVTVTAAEDPDAIADGVVNLTHSVSGGDYGMETASGVSVTITENDMRGVTVDPASLGIIEGSNDTYTVVLESQPSANVTVTVGGATSEVTASPSSLTFTTNNWNTAKTVTVTAAQDADAVTDSAVTLTNTASGGDYAGEAASVTVSVTEDDTAGVSVSPTSFSLQEGNSVTYTIVLATQPEAAVTLTASGFTNTDASVSPETLTFTTNNWDTERTVTVRATQDDDAIDEPRITVNHSVAGGDYGSVTVPSVTVDITDDDMRGVTVDLTSLTIDEGSSRDYTVVLESQPSDPVTITVGGFSGTDVSVSSSSLVFSPTDWDTEQTVTVTAAEDPDAIADSVVNLTHTAAGGDYEGDSVSGVAVTIEENDMRGVTVNTGVTPGSLGIIEGSSGTYTVVLESQPSANVTITVSGASGDVSVSHPSLVFTRTDWNTAKTVTVTAADDPDAIADATVNLAHFAAGGDYAGDPVSGVAVTITENDSRGVEVDPVSVGVIEGADGTYTVRLESQPLADVTVTVSGESGTDITVRGSPLTFTTNNWNTKQTITLAAAEDDDAIPDVRITLTNTANGGDYAGDSASVEVAITENDTAGVNINPLSLIIREGSSHSYGVVLVTQPSDTVTVTVSGISGEVTVSPAVLTFTTMNWRVEQNVVVSAGQDMDEASDSATLNHTARGGDYQNVTDISSVSVTVTDDEMAGVVVNPRSLSVTEGGMGTYGVSLSSEPEDSVTVTVGGVSGDVSVAPETLVFTRSDWIRVKTVTVTVAEDEDMSVDEPVTLTNSARGGGYDERSAEVVVTITENDSAGVTVSPTDVEVDEGESGTYTVVLTAEPSSDVTITVSGASGDVSVNPETLMFTTNNWNAEQTVTVTAAEDDDAVAGLPVTLSHAASGGGYGSVTVPSVSVRVTEKDEAGLDLSSRRVRVTEGLDVSYTVTLTAQPSADITVTASGASGDVSVNPETLTFTTNDWNTEQTVTVTAAEDSDADTDVEVTLTHRASGAGYGSVTDSVAVEVVEDDAAGISVAPVSLSVTEGGSATYALSLTAEPASNVTVTVSGASGDVSVNPETLTFTPADWMTAKMVTVTAAEDEDTTTDPAVRLTHAVSGGGYDDSAPPSVTVSITENDVPGVTVNPKELSIDEGGSGVYTVMLATEPTATATVTISGASDDVTAAPETLTFTMTDWTTAKTVTVTVAEDEDTTTDPAVRLTHAVSDGGYDSVAAPPVTVRINENDTAEVTVEEGDGQTDGKVMFTPGVSGDQEKGVMIDNSNVLVRVEVKARPDAPSKAAPPGVSLALPQRVVVSGTKITFDFTHSGTTDLPSGLLLGDTVVDIDLAGTSLGAGQTAEICLPAPGEGENPRIYHYDEGEWMALDTTRRDTIGGVSSICAETPGFSLFGAFARRILNRPPVAEAGEDQAVAQGEEITLDGSGSTDPDNDELVYVWRYEGERSDVVLSGEDTPFAPVFTAPSNIEEDVTLEFTLEVTDPRGESSTDTVSVMVSSRVAVTENGELLLIPRSTGKVPAGGGNMVMIEVLGIPSPGAAVSLSRDILADVTRVVFNFSREEIPAPSSGFLPGETVMHVSLEGGSLGGGTAGACLPLPDGEADTVIKLYDGDEKQWRALASPGRRTVVGVKSVCGRSGELALFGVFFPGINERDREMVAKSWLSRFGRTVVAQATDALGERMTQPLGLSRLELGGGASGFYGSPSAVRVGQMFAEDEIERNWGSEDAPYDPINMSPRVLLLGGASFQFAPKYSEDQAGSLIPGPWSIWGRGSTTRFEGVDGNISVDGRVSTGILGADYRWGRMMFGAAVSHSVSDGDFALSGSASELGGDVESSLTGAYPYLRFAVAERLSIWGMLGYGKGEMSVEDPRLRVKTDIRMRMGAFGMRGDILTGAKGFALAVKSEAFWVRMYSDAVAGLASVETDANRIRVTLEGGFTLPVGSGAFMPLVEAGFRHDGGDAERGYGMEIGGGFRYSNSAWGLDMEFRARRLMAHDDQDYREWGIGGSARLNPRASGRGLLMSLQTSSSLGDAQSGIERLWSRREVVTVSGADQSAFTGSFEAEVGYGVEAFSGRGVFVPYTGLGMSRGGDRGYRLGGRLDLDPSFSISIEGDRRENVDGVAEHGVMLRGSRHW